MKPSIELKVSNKCNLNCKHCLWKHKDNRTMDMHTLEKIVKDNPNISKIAITGGEPMLLKYTNLVLLNDIISSHRNIKWNIATNLCYTLNTERLNVLSNVTDICTSFDLHIRFGNIHNLLLWKKNVETLVKKGLKVRVSCCLTKYMVNKDPYKVKRLFDDLGVSSYAFLNLFDVGYTHDNYDELVPTKKEFHDWLQAVYDIGDFDKNEIFNFIKSNKYSCEFIHVDPIDIDGTVMHCMCEEKRDSKCRVTSECLHCDKYFLCGGSCVLSPCIYYDKDLFAKIKAL